MQKLSLLFISLPVFISAMEKENPIIQRSITRPQVRAKLFESLRCSGLSVQRKVGFSATTEIRDEILKTNIRNNGTADRTQWTTEQVLPSDLAAAWQGAWQKRKQNLLNRWGADQYGKIESFWVNEGGDKIEDQVQYLLINNIEKLRTELIQYSGNSKAQFTLSPHHHDAVVYTTLDGKTCECSLTELHMIVANAEIK